MKEFKECELCKILYDGIFRARRADSPSIMATILYETEEKRTDFLIEQKTKTKGKKKR
jgi:hypothetical protein